MTVIRESNGQRYIGLSTDTKPASASVGSIFHEYDTNDVYICRDGTNWVIDREHTIDIRREEVIHVG